MDKPNVVLVTCDCLRADFVGCCADRGEQSLTPNLDRFAEQGVVFKNAFSQGYGTGVSMPSLFTGRYPSRLPAFKMQSPFGLRQHIQGVLVNRHTTITEVLARQEYQTAGIHSNPFLTSLFGFDKGFEFFYDDMFLGKSQLPRGLKRWASRAPRMLRLSPYLSAAKMNRRAARFLRTAKDPFFLFLHYMDTHGPYQSKKGLQYLNKMRSELLYHKATKHPKAVTDEECSNLLAWYKEEVAYLDHHLGGLFDELESTGKMDNTLVIVTADHGDEFREHGRFSHKSTLYDELLHVPLISRFPDSRLRGKVTSEMVALLQVVPTILDFLGIPPDYYLDGKSLLPWIERGDDRALHDLIISEAKFGTKWKACIRDSEWKLIVDRSNGKRELFNWRNDPKEQSEVAQANASIAADLERKLGEHFSGNGAKDGQSKSSAKGMDKEVVDKLKALGYL